MKIQCDVCEKGPATIICCADEAALCAKCDIEVHQANKLASKHQRLFLDSLSNKLPKCDICQDKTAFIFCVEDRALFCRDCDDSVHSVGTLSSNHQRLLATGIRVSLTSNCCCAKDTEKQFPEPPNNQNLQPFAMKVPSPQPSSVFANSSSWAVDDLLKLSNFQSGDKKETMEFGELEWFTGIGLFNNELPREPMAAAEVPQLHISSSSQQFNFHPTTFNRSIKPYSNTPNKRPRIEISNDDEDNLFTVPDLG